MSFLFSLFFNFQSISGDIWTLLMIIAGLYVAGSLFYWILIATSKRFIKGDDEAILRQIHRRFKWPAYLLLMLIISTVNVYIVSPGEEVFYTLKQLLTILYIVT